MSLPQKELVEELKMHWKKLWQERVDDKIRAEGVAAAEYAKLSIEKGTVIHATRGYKALSFKEVLEQHQIANADRFVSPPPGVGGWTKFVKANITGQRQRKNVRAAFYCEGKTQKQQLKKGGRGWLHK